MYQDEIYIAPNTLEEVLHILQDNYKIKINPHIFIKENFHMIGGKMTCQIKKYL